MKNLICSKATFIGGGGGRASFKPQPSPNGGSSSYYTGNLMNQLSTANVAITIDNKGKISYLKNRWGEDKKDLNPQEVTILLSDMLARNLFNDRMAMFQESFKAKVVEAIREVIKREGSN